MHRDERVGLNRLFIDRADDAVEHPPDLAQKLPQEQRPDRIYGLRQTRNFENLLLASLAEGEYVEDKLARQPHAGVGGEPLLFPFLVVEAKAGNAADDWASICLQTSFPTDQKTTAAKAVACLVLVGDQCRPEVARSGWAR